MFSLAPCIIGVKLVDKRVQFHRATKREQPNMVGHDFLKRPFYGTS